MENNLKNILALVVADKGFIFVGMISWENHEILGPFLHIRNAENVRKWENGGFGGICRGARSAQATLDSAGEQMIPRSAVVSICPLPEGWHNL